MSRFQTALNQIVATVTQLSNPVVICNEAVSILYRDLGYQRGCVVLGRSGGLSRVLVAHCPGAGAANDHLAEMKRVQQILDLPEPGVIARVIEQGRAIVVNDVAREPAYLEGDFVMRSEACVPLLDRATCIGALNVESAAPGRFRAEDVQFLSTVAALLSPSVARINGDLIR